MKVIFTRGFLALIPSIAVVGLGSGATPLTALALTQVGYGTDVLGIAARLTDHTSVHKRP